jgi:arginine decarboxylase
MPYPPGLPMLMSGENFGVEDGPQIGYLRGLQSWDQQFSGFEHVTEGAEIINGTYHVLCEVAVVECRLAFRFAQLR